MKTSKNKNQYEKYKFNWWNYTVDKSFKPKEGTYGIVYKVNDKNGNSYACKVLKQISDKELYNEMINTEMSVMIDCANPTIITFFGYSRMDFDGNKNCCILLEFAQNGSMHDYLNANKDNLTDNLIRQKMLIGISYGMMKLHEKNFIHLDLKPQNVLLDKNFEIKIADFGTAQVIRNNREIQKQMGTPLYMAPEVLSDVTAGMPADVYSFGILMYEVITRKTPYYDRNIRGKFKLKKMVVDDEIRPTFDGKIKKSLKKLIEQCWAVDPGQRPTFQEIFYKLSANIELGVKNILQSEASDEENNYFLDGVNDENLMEYLERIDPDKKMKIDKSVKNNTPNEITPVIAEIEKNYFDQSMKQQLRIKDLENENEKIQKELSENEKKVQAKKIKYCQLKKENEELKKSNNEKQTQIDNLTKEIDELKRKLTELEKIQDEKELLLKSTEENINAVIFENEQLVKDKADLKLLKKKCDEKISKLTEEKGNYQKENLEYRQIYNQNESNKKYTNEKIKQMSMQIEELTQELQKKKKHFSFFKKEMQEQSKIVIKNTDLYRRIFFNGFNAINAQAQKNYILEIKKNISDENILKYFNKIYSVLEYLLSLQKIKENPKYLSILPNVKANSSNENNDDFHELNQICLLSDALELLYHHDKLLSKQMTDLIISFDYVLMEIKYPSDSYNGIYNTLLPLDTIKMSVFISNLKITDQMFHKNKKISNVKFGPDVREIQDSSFQNCYSLSHVEFSNADIIKIGSQSFSFCCSLSKIILPSSVKTIGHSAFFHCDSLTDVYIPDSVTEIGSNAFGNCEKLSRVRISKNLTKLQRLTFRHCGLTKILIPSSIRIIEEEVFSNCLLLNKVVFEDSNDLNSGGLSIGNRAFMNCKEINKIIFPTHLRLICSEAFKDCIYLTELYFKSALNSICENAFLNCPLDKLHLSRENKKIFTRKNLGFNRNNELEYDYF